jgi:hypothetical protein
MFTEQLSSNGHIRHNIFYLQETVVVKEQHTQEEFILSNYLVPSLFPESRGVSNTRRSEHISNHSV